MRGEAEEKSEKRQKKKKIIFERILLHLWNIICISSIIWTEMALDKKAGILKVVN